jgi:hypothetical protein
VARQRYRKRQRQQEEPGLFEVVVDLAAASTAFGIGATGVLGIAGLVFVSQPKWMGGFSPLVGLAVLLFAGCVGIVTLIGWLKRVVTGGPRERAGKPGGAPGARRGWVPRSARGVNDSDVSAAPLPRIAAPVIGPAGSMLSQGEMAFYDPLRDIVAGRFEIHVKPSLVDVIGRRDASDFHEIAKMHVDFLLCDRATLRPRLAIELDDASHRSPQRRWVDGRKAELLQQAGVPLLRVRCAQAYDVAEIRETIDRAAGG